jgi:hypothetical protein
MTYLAIAIALLIVAAIVAWDIWRSRRKKLAPDADFWIGPIGLTQYMDTYVLMSHRPRPKDPSEAITKLFEDIEEFTSRKLDPVVILFCPAPIPLPGGGTAAGIYHSTAKGWDHAWIELYSWEALPHELLHHATGLEDTLEFRELLQRFEATRRTNG